MSTTTPTSTSSNRNSLRKVVNVLWSNRAFGGAEVYVETMHTTWGTDTVALQCLNRKGMLYLMLRIAFSQSEMFIFHDLRAAALGFLRPTRRNITVIHGPGKRARLTKLLVSLQAFTQRHVVLVSNNIHPDPPTDRVVVLENFSSAGIKANDLSADAIFFGRITESKGVSQMLKFWHAHKPGSTLHVIGDGDLLEEMKCLYNHEGSGIVFYGALPHVEISHIASSCRYYISFSDREGLSLSLLEAMDGGLIPLVTDLPSQRFIFEIPGLSPVTSYYQMLTAHISHINSLPPPERHELRKTIRNHVRACFRDRWFGFWKSVIEN